jgi:hypothetical protein
MRRLAPLLPTLLTACAARAGAPAPSPNISSRDDATPTTPGRCDPRLVEVGDGLAVPALIADLLADAAAPTNADADADGTDTTVTVSAVQLERARTIEWKVGRTISPTWLRDGAAAAIRRVSGATPRTDDTGLSTTHHVVWTDDAARESHVLIVGAYPTSDETLMLTYACGVSSPAHQLLTAADAAALTPAMSTSWIEGWVLEALARAPLSRASASRDAGGREYVWTLTAPHALAALDAAARARGLRVETRPYDLGNTTVTTTSYLDPAGGFEVTTYPTPEGAVVHVFAEGE